MFPVSWHFQVLEDPSPTGVTCILALPGRGKDEFELEKVISLIRQEHLKGKVTAILMNHPLKKNNNLEKYIFSLFGGKFGKISA